MAPWLTSLVLLMVCIQPLLVTGRLVCPQEWMNWHGRCYSFLSGMASWHAARASCRSQAGTIASPVTQQEQDFLWDTFLDIHGGNPEKGQWINCNTQSESCPLTSGDWPYAFWGTSNASAYQGCVFMSRKDRLGAWMLTSCGKEKHAVCERRATGAPLYCQVLAAHGYAMPHCMLGGALGRRPFVGVAECGRACLAEKRCSSFSIVPGVGGTGSGAGSCQLNNATVAEEARGSTLPNGDQCLYFEL